MAKGFFTDTTLCIGCKACEVACKQWNQLPAEEYEFSAKSYDNTMQLSGTTWRHVKFIERTTAEDGVPASRWLMMSDVCKHCTHAGCLEACPTGAIIRNEFDDVYVQPDVCNGCGYCVPSCPFGVIDMVAQAAVPSVGPAAGDRDCGSLASGGVEGDESVLQRPSGIAAKCTLCYDRQNIAMTPACAKACPTESIQFGDVDDLKARAKERVTELRTRGVKGYLYGVDETTSVGDLNAFFLLTEPSEAYNLPAKPVLPSTHQPAGYAAAAAAAAVLALAGIAIFWVAPSGPGAA
ncbi:MAG: 4Fe-4S dicluster domain-containing protein [Candidatus Eremiobacteraeota bacterium]|nr:4Fe-4S dicluster domain-containing protein [Candidatus Eremiobacteraeota bacterium]MBC5826232.1 4Fe-4S dicluster domain-containing protein [Candidatus Eremiobacteraeota bacterium]